MDNDWNEQTFDVFGELLTLVHNDCKLTYS
jgi:hypothetical protein